ncbi:MAG: hypothetical protein KY443_08015 [Actinobacteria bacterium]|nr:hypothetical protein [Actinomycetota bacterium]
MAASFLFAAACSDNPSGSAERDAHAPDAGDHAATSSDSTVPPGAVGGSPTSVPRSNDATSKPSTSTDGSGSTESTGSTGSSQSPPSTTPRAADGGEYFGGNTPGFPLHVEITPRCIKRGTKVTVTVDTRPYAVTVTYARYSDNKSYGASGTGNAGPSGSWVWIFVVSPDAPLGPAEIYVVAQDRSPDSNDEGASSSGEGAAKKYRFEVVKSC